MVVIVLCSETTKYGNLKNNNNKRTQTKSVVLDQIGLSTSGVTDTRDSDISVSVLEVFLTLGSKLQERL